LSCEVGLEIHGFAPLFGTLIYMAVMFPFSSTAELKAIVFYTEQSTV